MISAISISYLACLLLVLSFFSGAGANRECDLEEQATIIESQSPLLTRNRR